MKRIKLTIVTLFVSVGLLSTTPLFTASAQQQLDPCSLNPNSSVCHYGVTRSDSRTIIKNIVNILLYIVGAAAVVVIILSGIKYVISSGDSGKVADAKRTLIYAVVGLLIAIIAQTIVNWVFSILR